MDSVTDFRQTVRKVNDNEFDSIALALFKIQAKENLVYNRYLSVLGVDSTTIKRVEDIPFLPISFFKTHDIVSGVWKPETVFTSSGTTGMITSKHLVKNVSFYLNHAMDIFTSFFDTITNYHFLALLPSYLEREGSSLIAMANYFINESNSIHSGFYLNNLQDLVKKLEVLKTDRKKTILLGVPFALLELAENYEVDLSNFIVMETGGMKGRRKEMIREDLHEILCSRFKVSQITSEYGMTELFSQAYSLRNGYYQCPWSMKILIRDVYDPFRLEDVGRIGIIKVIDLANIDSCAFLETQDLGRMNNEGNFEVLGRVDNSDSRGCNLLV